MSRIPKYLLGLHTMSSITALVLAQTNFRQELDLGIQCGEAKYEQAISHIRNAAASTAEPGSAFPSRDRPRAAIHS